MQFSRTEYWSGQPFPSLGIFPTHGSNPGLPHCRQILNQLSHKGSPRMLEWVPYPFESVTGRKGGPGQGSPNRANRLQVPDIFIS